MWVQFNIRVPRENVALIEAVLEAHGALSVTLTDPEDHPVLEPGVGETPLWPKVLVTGLFEKGYDPGPLRSLLSQSIAPDDLVLTEVGDRDWERAWLDDFKPMQFGKKLWIIPGGQQPPDPDATNIELDPGLAFGSGTHPTTRLCLEWIEGQDLDGQSVMDFGCGSGILGIAAAMKGADSVLCVDNDPQALLATKENAARNHVASRIITRDAADFDGDKADFIVANILAGTLVQLASRLCALLKPGSLIALSGILSEQAEQVSAAYSGSLENIEIQTLEEWVLISGRKTGIGP